MSDEKIHVDEDQIDLCQYEPPSLPIVFVIFIVMFLFLTWLCR